jgi:hypothetical protein
MFNSSISQGTMPTLWKKAYEVPIPKTRPPKSIQNDLRPISLTPTIRKVLDSLVGRWVLSKIADKFDARQFGALKSRSTIHALIDITHIAPSTRSQHTSRHSTIRLFMRKWLHFASIQFCLNGHSYLLRRQQCVKIGRTFSSWKTLNGGMPQWTWLGPYIFLTIINNLETNQPAFKFVDKITIMGSSNQAGSSQMQVASDQITE